MNDELQKNLTSGERWLRLVYMIMFALIIQVAGTVMWLLVILQFVFSIIKGNDHEQLRAFGGTLSTYIYQILRFLSYKSDEKPFPFDDWPND